MSAGATARGTNARFSTNARVSGLGFRRAVAALLEVEELGRLVDELRGVLVGAEGFVPQQVDDEIDSANKANANLFKMAARSELIL